MTNNNHPLSTALWKIYNRSDESLPWATGADFPWHDPVFGGRTLYEHLDDSHGAASRNADERALQIDWLWKKLGLQPGMHLFDVTCGPGLYAVEFARRGCTVTGIDINPAAIAYATDLAAHQGVAANCIFIEQDVRQLEDYEAQFDAALLLYEQLAVVSKDQARTLLKKIVKALKPGGRLCVELLNPENVDKKNSTWWFTDDTGLWGDSPFLHLGERIWDEETQASIERYHIVDLETGQLNEYAIYDQTYPAEEMKQMMQQAGFASVEVYTGWDGLDLYDAKEWMVYVASK